MKRQVTCLLLDINILPFFFFFLAISLTNPVKLTVGATVYSESYWPPQERRDQIRNHKKAYLFLHGATSSMLAPKFSSISSRSQRVGRVISSGIYECLSIVAPKAAETVRTLIALAPMPQSASILSPLGSCSAMLSNWAGWTISTRWNYGPNNMPAL